MASNRARGPQIDEGETPIEQQDVAAMIGVSRPTVKRLWDTQGLPGYLVGARLKFYRSEVLAWMATRRRVRNPADRPREDAADSPGIPALAGTQAIDRKAEARELRRRRKAGTP